MDREKLNEMCGVGNTPSSDWEIIAAWHYQVATGTRGVTRERYEEAKRRLGVE